MWQTGVNDPLLGSYPLHPEQQVAPGIDTQVRFFSIILKLFLTFFCI